MSWLPDNRGPILDKIVKSGLLFLPADPAKIIESCLEQLSPAALKKFVRQQNLLENAPPMKDNGFFDLLPHEILLKIFTYLDLSSLISCSAVSSLFKSLSSDPLLYLSLDLRPLFHCLSSPGLSWLQARCSRLAQLDLSWCGNYGSISPSSLQWFIEVSTPY